MNSPNLLKIAYAANLFILIPVCFNMFSATRMLQVFDGKVPNSDGIRLLVASLWSAILVGSAVGLVWPEAMSLILPIQIFYKSTWLITFVIPKLSSGQRADIPMGISIVFALIVISYPIIYWLAR
jgi:hypothetical protein